jgi:hypothetical protein
LAIAGCSSSPILVIIDSTNEQGGATRLHFEAVVAAVELPVARGKLELRIKTFLANPLCRGVDELCTQKVKDFAVVAVCLEETMSEKTELHTQYAYPSKKHILSRKGPVAASPCKGMGQWH